MEYQVVVTVNEPTPGAAYGSGKYAGVAGTVRAPYCKTIVARCGCGRTASSHLCISSRSDVTDPQTVLSIASHSFRAFVDSCGNI